MAGKKNRIVAALLALFLGHWGVHKFYLGENQVGFIYIILGFIWISFILGFIDFLRLISMTDQAFDQKYNGLSLEPPSPSHYMINNSDQDKIKSLEGLKKLYDQGIITPEEYEEKRQFILDSFGKNYTPRSLNQSQNYHQNNLNVHRKKQPRTIEKIDINSCSKDDLVYQLGLPIVYANDLDSLRNEGYIFTDLDQLEYVLGIPPLYIKKIENLVTFGLDYKKEAEYSWRKLNSLNVEELMTFNLSLEHAQTIVNERLKRGQYKSLLDVKKRTGIPLEIYHHLV